VKVGDLVQKNQFGRAFASGIGKGEFGVVVKTDESLSVTSHCVLVAFPTKTEQWRCSMLEIINESR